MIQSSNMKKIAVILALLLYVGDTQCQELIKYYNYIWEECPRGEAAFVSIAKPNGELWERSVFFNGTGYTHMHGFYKDSNYTIKQGWFSWYYASKKIKEAGQYQNNKKQGTWVSYHYNGMMNDSAFYNQNEWQGTYMAWHPNGIMKDSAVRKENGLEVGVSWFDNGLLSSAGYYLNGRPHKTWQYYHSNGNLAAVETYDNGEVVSKRFYTEDGLLQADTIETERPALFGKAPGDWKKYIKKMVYFPTNYTIENGKMVVVTVVGTINENGEVEDVHVDIPVHPDFDRILLNTIKKSPQWRPAISHNRRVKDAFREALSFTMND
jgi:antitoxin component YwqK of YwqJK toxin-antitoxin module